jgi:cell division protein FtsQ
VSPTRSSARPPAAPAAPPRRRSSGPAAAPPARTGDRAARSAKPGTAAADRKQTRAADEVTVDRPHRRRVVLWTLGLVTLVVALAVGTAVSPLLAVDAVQVTGVTPDHVAEVRRASGLAVGDSIVTFLPRRVAGRVRTLPWVGDVRVVRSLPHTVRIEVVPRVPVGWTTAGSGVLVVDAASQVLWKADTPPVGLPELDGVADLASPGHAIRPASLAAAAAALGPELRSRTTALTLADGSLTAQIAGGPQIRYGTPSAVGAKARVAAAVLATLGGAPVTYIDVSVPAAPASG